MPSPPRLRRSRNRGPLVSRTTSANRLREGVFGVGFTDRFLADMGSLLIFFHQVLRDDGASNGRSSKRICSATSSILICLQKRPRLQNPCTLAAALYRQTQTRVFLIIYRP